MIINDILKLNEKSKLNERKKYSKIYMKDSIEVFPFNYILINITVKIINLILFISFLFLIKKIII